MKKYGYDYSETLRDSSKMKKIFKVMTKNEKIAYVTAYILMILFVIIGIYFLIRANFILGIILIALEFPLGWINQYIRRKVKKRIGIEK